MQSFFYVNDCRKFSREFIAVEVKHPQKLTEMKVGVIYCRPEQTHPLDMFKNGQGDDTLCSSFWTWVSAMSKEINLEQWIGYRGDMGTTGKTFYKKWCVSQNERQNEIEIIYHMAPLMDAEGHRRLIGNDMAVIFFLEEGHDFQLDPTCVEALGTVPQIFVVVQPYQGKYRIGFFSYTNIKSFDPAPAHSAISTDKMKDLILTKLYNGCLMVSRFCPPLHRLFYVPRGETLEAILEKYLPPQVSVKKIRKKEEAKILEEKRRRTHLTDSDLIRITVVAARIESDQTHDVMVTMSLLGVQQKTKTIKHCTKPIWNEDFTFDLLGADKDFTDFKIGVNCNRTNSFLGEVRIPMFDVLYLIGTSEEQPQWFVLMRKKADDKAVFGEILLKFSNLSEQEAKQYIQAEQQPKTPRSFRKSTILSASKSKIKV